MEKSDGGTPVRFALGEWMLNVLAVLVLVLMAAIVLQVVASAVDWNPLATFDGDWPLVGHAITLNSLLDFQWHLLVVVALLPIGIVWLRDGHVRVDFLYGTFSPRWQARINLAGDLLLTLPFIVMCVPASWSFMLRAYASGEHSDNSGLADRFLIKSALPVGFAILAVILVVALPSLIRRALGGQSLGRQS